MRHWNYLADPPASASVFFAMRQHAAVSMVPVAFAEASELAGGIEQS